MGKTMENLARLLLRLAVGGMLLFHGVHKLTHGIDSIAGMLQKNGLPAFIAYGVYVGEVLAPILLLLGVWARPAGLIVAFNMCVAVALTKSDRIFALSERGGGLVVELDALYLVGGLAIAFLGAGRWSVSKGEGRWN